MLCALLLSAGCGVGPEENTAAAVGSAAPIEPGSPVPPELRHEPRRLIDSENALPVLLEAGDNVSLDFGDDALLEALGAIAEEEASYPVGEAATALDAHIDANERALALLDAALARGAIELPKNWVLQDWDASMKLMQVVRLAETRLGRAKRNAADGKLEQSARDIIACGALGELIVESRSYMHASIAGAHWRRTARIGARWFARLADATPALIENILEGIPRVRERQLVADLLPQEWSVYTLPSILRVPEHADLETLGGYFSGAESPDDRHGKIYTAAFVELLRGHPRPFDRAQTVAEGERLYIDLLAYLRGPWKLPEFDAGEVQAVKEIWCEELYPEAAAPSTTCWYPLDPPAPERLATAREALLRYENPAGKLLLARILPFIERGRHFEEEADREATRAVLALRLHAARKGAYPETLAELVSGGILPSEPIDPFTDGPLGWSREELALSSTGPAGDGVGLEGNELVWRVPATPPRRRP